MNTHTFPTITARLDRARINAEGRSVRFLLAEVTAPAVERSGAPRVPLNLAVVIDASGSMTGPPLAAAKMATAGVIEQLAADDRLSVVSFADDVQVHCDAVLQDAEGRDLAATRLGPVNPRGCTNLAAGWLKGCECVARVMEVEPRLRNRVMLLSDGHANQGLLAPSELERHAAELRARGILSSTIGIGVNYSPTQLQAIAEQGGGRMHDAERPQEIIEIMLAELQDVAMTALENVELRLELPAGVEVESVGGLPTTADPTGFRVVLGAMLSAARRQVVLKLTLPKGNAGDSLRIPLSAHWRWPGETNAQRFDAGGVELVFDSEAACAQQPRDAAVARDVARNWQMAIVRRVMSLNADGAYRAAAEYARSEIRWFERYCRGLPDAAALLEPLEHLAQRADEEHDPVARKEMMLASYKFMRGEEDRRSHKRKAWDQHIRP